MFVCDGIVVIYCPIIRRRVIYLRVLWSGCQAADVLFDGVELGSNFCFLLWRLWDHFLQFGFLGVENLSLFSIVVFDQLLLLFYPLFLSVDVLFGWDFWKRFFPSRC